jgi:hypothetical protein
VFGPIMVWSFVGTGLYAWHRRPASRVGLLMVLLGFAWCVAALSFANSRLVFSFALVFGGLWGDVFLPRPGTRTAAQQSRPAAFHVAVTNRGVLRRLRSADQRREVRPATEATVVVRTTGGRVTIEVTDDGVGGADAGRGSGLSGLTDRVTALDGTLAVQSPADGGTQVRRDPV